MPRNDLHLFTVLPSTCFCAQDVSPSDRNSGISLSNGWGTPPPPRWLYLNAGDACAFLARHGFRRRVRKDADVLLCHGRQSRNNWNWTVSREGDSVQGTGLILSGSHGRLARGVRGLSAISARCRTRRERGRLWQEAQRKLVPLREAGHRASAHQGSPAPRTTAPARVAKALLHEILQHWAYQAMRAGPGQLSSRGSGRGGRRRRHVVRGRRQGVRIQRGPVRCSTPEYTSIPAGATASLADHAPGQSRHTQEAAPRYPGLLQDVPACNAR